MSASPLGMHVFLASAWVVLIVQTILSFKIIGFLTVLLIKLGQSFILDIHFSTENMLVFKSRFYFFSLLVIFVIPL